MPTFLTTSKMSPALAARVEASVTGRSVDNANTRATGRRRVKAIARIVLVLALVLGLWSGFSAWRQSRIALESARVHLLDKARSESATLSASDKHAIAHVQAWLVRLTGLWEGDALDDQLGVSGLTPFVGAGPFLYVRGPIDALSQPSTIEAAAAASVKDTLLLCLIDPPSARTEKVLVDKVRVASGAASALEIQTPNAHRLDELFAGMPFLLPPWSDAVRVAPDRETIARMQRDFERAPIALAKQAARASLLLVAIDEPGPREGPTELDGERPHAIRLYLVDLEADKPILRLRRTVDPSWISNNRRPHYARGIDSCAFAFDVQDTIKKSGARHP
jgi:hypothetical protein